MTYKDASDLVEKAVAALEEQQKDNRFKYAYITGALSAMIKQALSGDIENVTYLLNKTIKNTTK